jgi:hypothetical protein
VVNSTSISSQTLAAYRNANPVSSLLVTEPFPHCQTHSHSLSNSPLKLGSTSSEGPAHGSNWSNWSGSGARGVLQGPGRAQLITTRAHQLPLELTGAVHCCRVGLCWLKLSCLLQVQQLCFMWDDTVGWHVPAGDGAFSTYLEVRLSSGL